MRSRRSRGEGAAGGHRGAQPPVWPRHRGDGASTSRSGWSSCGAMEQTTASPASTGRAGEAGGVSLPRLGAAPPRPRQSPTPIPTHHRGQARSQNVRCRRPGRRFCAVLRRARQALCVMALRRSQCARVEPAQITVPIRHVAALTCRRLTSRSHTRLTRSGRSPPILHLACQSAQSGHLAAAGRLGQSVALHEAANALLQLFRRHPRIGTHFRLLAVCSCSESSYPLAAVITLRADFDGAEVTYG